MSQRKSRLVIAAAASLAALSMANFARAQQVGDVFVIALENHNFTQPASLNSTIDPIDGDSAAPFIQSLITPGNPNAAHTSYETAYYNAGKAEHPSEPNYVWSEAGSNFNPLTPSAAGGGNSTAGGPTSTTQGTINGTDILNDNDPSASNGNIFPTSFASDHLTGQLNAAGIAWKNYQEDFQYSTSPTVSANGSGGTANGIAVTANPYNGSLQYNYAVKHNPMAFFADTATKNVEQMSQLQADLTNNTVGRYNWITPDMYNDMHTALTGGYTDPRTNIHYTGDQAEIAQGDHFLSIVVPERSKRPPLIRTMARSSFGTMKPKTRTTLPSATRKF